MALIIPDSPKDNLTTEVAAAWERGVETPDDPRQSLGGGADSVDRAAH